MRLGPPTAGPVATGPAVNDVSSGRVLGVPLVWFPILQQAAPDQRARYALSGGGISLHWPEWDEELSIAGLMAGVDESSA